MNRRIKTPAHHELPQVARRTIERRRERLLHRSCCASTKLPFDALEHRRLMAAISIGDGDVHTYPAITETTVTMTGRSALYVTGSTGALISRGVVNLDSDDAWLFFENVKPSVVNSTYLSGVRINGVAATLNANVRVVQYGEYGAVVIPQGTSFGAMQVYSGPLFTGESKSLTTYAEYDDAALGTLSNAISSFKLKRGYSATVAQYANGSGISKNYVAQDGDIEVAMMPSGLDNSVSFVRVFPWKWSTKKGAGNLQGGLNLGWWYNWDITSSSTLDREYVPIRQHGDRPTLEQDWQARGSSQLMGFNEPDRPDQANISVSTAINEWPSLLETGMRVGAPAVADGAHTWWLYPFMDQADAASLRVDYVPIHYYQGHDPADPQGAATRMYNHLRSVYDRVKKPLWITEWNNGANWTNAGDPTFEQQAASIAAMIDMLDKAPFVERYAIYNWVEDVRRVMWDNGSLTQAGVVYRDNESPIAYTQVVPDTSTPVGASFRFEADARDGSGNGHHAVLHGKAKFGPGKTGLGLTLSGNADSEDYVSLSPRIGDSTDFTFGGWVNWDGGAGGQKIFELANNVPGLANRYLYLSPSAADGRLKVALYNGSVQQELNFTAALPTGVWKHVAFTISGNTGKLFIDGQVVATNTGMSINPVDLGTAHNYIGKGRNLADPLFAGKLDELTFLPYALDDAQVLKLTNNAAPAFATDAIAGGSAVAGAAYSSSISGAATDADGDPLLYVKVAGPAWLTVAANGTLTGTPPVGTEGLQEFVVSVADPAGLTDTVALNIEMTSSHGDGVWLSQTGQQWNTSSNWSGNFPANGPTRIADFSTLDVAVDKLVTLGSSRTIGGLSFGDLVGTQNWTLNNSGGAVLTLEGNSPLVRVNQNTATVSAPLAGREGLTKAGDGRLLLSGANSFTGKIFVTRGILNLGSSQAAGSDGIVNQAVGGRNAGIQLQGGIAIPSGVDFILSNDAQAGVATVPYAILNVSGNNSIGGRIYLTTGAGNSVIQSDSGALTLSGEIRPQHRIGARTLILQGTSTAANLITGLLRNHTTSTDVLSLIKNGTGTWRLDNANLYTGGTIVNGGELHVGNDAALGTGTVTINAGILVPRSASRVLTNAIVAGGDFGLGLAGVNNSLTLSGSLNLGGSARLVTVGDTTFAVDVTFAGVISNGGLTKGGTGTLSLTGANTYSGATTVAAGTLLLGAADRIADVSGLTLAGGSFDTGGFNETLGSLTLSDNSTINLGAGASTLRFSGPGAFAGGKTLNVANWTQNGDRLFVGTGATLTATQLSQIRFNGVPAIQLSSGEVVPETAAPATVVASTFDHQVAPNVLSIVFSADVSSVLDLADLSIARSGGGTVTPTTMTYDLATNTARFALATPLPNGDYTATLSAAGLDGRLTSDYATTFFSLAGDINHDRIVDFGDLLILAANYNSTGRSFDAGNLDYDAEGNVDFSDLLILAANYNTGLAATSPTAALMLPPSPTTTAGSDDPEDRSSIGDLVL